MKGRTNYIANHLTRVSVSQDLDSEDWDLKMWTPQCPWVLHISFLLSGLVSCSKNVMWISGNLCITKVKSVDSLVSSSLLGQKVTHILQM